MLTSSCSAAPGITCPHGNLAPEKASAAARRMAIPSSLWSYLKDRWAGSQRRQQAQQTQQQGQAQQQQQQQAQHNGQAAPEVVDMTEEVNLLSPARSNGTAGPAAGAPAAADAIAAAQSDDDGEVQVTGELPGLVCHEFLAGSAECTQCRRQLAEAAACDLASKRDLDAERTALAQLHKGLLASIMPGCM